MRKCISILMFIAYPCKDSRRRSRLDQFLWAIQHLRMQMLRALGESNDLAPYYSPITMNLMMKTWISQFPHPANCPGICIGLFNCLFYVQNFVLKCQSVDMCVCMSTDSSAMVVCVCVRAFVLTGHTNVKQPSCNIQTGRILFGISLCVSGFSTFKHGNE